MPLDHLGVFSLKLLVTEIFVFVAQSTPIKATLRTVTRETITFLIKLVLIVSIFRTFFFSAFSIFFSIIRPVSLPISI